MTDPHADSSSREQTKGTPGTSTERRLLARLDDQRRELELKDRMLTGNLLQMERVTGKLRQILASMSSAVLMIELDGHLSEANPRALQLLGIENELPVLASRALPESLLSILDEVVGEGRHVAVEEVLLESGGRLCTLRVDCRLVRDDAGHPVGVLQIIDDRTELMQMEHRLEQSRTLVALGEMAASVAHELRNPLGGIGGFAALLREQLEPGSDAARYVDKIIEGVEGLNKVATNLLAYTRPVEPRMQPTDLKGLLREVMAFVQIEVEQGRFPVELALELGNQPLEMMADQELLRQCFLNLLKNAVQAMDGQAGHVGIEVRGPGEDAEVAEITVWDTGPGIDPALHAKIFNPFFTTRAKGTGLGLAIVRKNIELHGGSIVIQSAPGAGCRFVVRLPLAGRTTREERA